MNHIKDHSIATDNFINAKKFEIKPLMEFIEQEIIQMIAKENLIFIYNSVPIIM
jgi:hypothetical protein